MEDLIRERIKSYLTVKGITVNRIAKETKYPAATLQKQINGTTLLSGKTIKVIFEYCTDLSAEWVIRGKGDMILQPVSKTINVIKQGGNGDGQTNFVGDGNEMTDKQALKMALEQNQKLIDAILKGK